MLWHVYVEPLVQASTDYQEIFFEIFWEVIKVDLVAGLNGTWDVGCLPEHFKEGLIFLIPKVQGIITDVRQWRPITLLNTIYKIFANILAMH